MSTATYTFDFVLSAQIDTGKEPDISEAWKCQMLIGVYDAIGSDKAFEEVQRVAFSCRAAERLYMALPHEMDVALEKRAFAFARKQHEDRAATP